MDYLWLGLGAALGANGRFLLGRWVGDRWGTDLPYGTFIINVSGSFVIGLLGIVLARQMQATPSLRLFLIVGLLGGYTTFSSFSREALTLVEQDRWVPALGYMGLSAGLGLLACAGGVWVGRLVNG